jgi:hypothetical protein
MLDDTAAGSLTVVAFNPAPAGLSFKNRSEGYHQTSGRRGPPGQHLPGIGGGRPASGSPLTADAPLRCSEPPLGAKNRPNAVQQKAVLFGHLVGKCEQGGGYRQAECFRGCGG